VKKVECYVVGLCMVFAANVSAEERSDPLEGMNRAVYSFNKGFDTVLFNPLAKGYKAITPDIVETGVSNFFGNFRDVGTMVNNVLQFKLHDASVDFTRVIFNSTVGLAGILDVATHMGLQKNHEDFGQTLGAWGVPSGPYLVLPFFGPSTLRDAPASFVPLDAWTYVDDAGTRDRGLILRAVNGRAQLFKYEALIIGDEYIFIRDAYLGLRQLAVDDGVVEEVFDEDDF